MCVLVFGRKKKSDKQNPYEHLRSNLLNAEPSQLGFDPGEYVSKPYALLMETGYDIAVASLICLADGSASLYFSNGGGIIGGGQHESVATVAKRAVDAAAEYFEDMDATTDFPLPAVGHVRFQLLSAVGGRSTDALEQDLGNQVHRLSPLFYAGQHVITAIRTLDPPPSQR